MDPMVPAAAPLFTVLKAHMGLKVPMALTGLMVLKALMAQRSISAAARQKVLMAQRAPTAQQGQRDLMVQPVLMDHMGSFTETAYRSVS